MDCLNTKNRYSKECNQKLEEIEQQNRLELLDNPSKNEDLYPTLDDPNFSVKISHKKEFSDTKYDGSIRNIEEYSDVLAKSEFELSPHQIFVKNFLSMYTPYNSLLLYHGLGSGKTCSAIGVAEEMRDYYSQMGIDKKIIIIASPNVQDNFKLQLFDERKLKEENGSWTITGCLANKLIKEINPTRMKGLTKERLVQMAKNIINHYYTFTGYIQFSNEIELYRKDGKIKELQRKYSDCLIVIDEVHNISLSADSSSKTGKKGKKRTGEGIGKNLLFLVTICQNIRLLLLSATPMFNDYRDIVWFMNLLNLNDNRSIIKISDVFNKNGEFVENTGKELLLKKSTGYISFVRGENPYMFPFRIYPAKFADNSILNSKFVYPIYQLNCAPIDSKDKISKVDVFLNKIGSEQAHAYRYVVSLLRVKLNKKNTGKLGFLDLQLPLECLNIVYPSTELNLLPYTECEITKLENLEFDEESISNEIEDIDQSVQLGGDNEEEEEGNMEDEEEEEELNDDYDFGTIHINPKELTGSEGLKKVMNYQDTLKPSVKGKFEYKNETIEKYGSLFSYEIIGKYSSKIKSILDSIIDVRTNQVSEGIILVYSSFIDGGLVPMALALEEMGMNKYGGKNLFASKPTGEKTFDVLKKYTYVMITGDGRLSPNNAVEVKHLTSDNNKEGERIKVVLISVAGSEGLDFKFIRQVHILDPWYNLNRIEQIIGRGVRNMSHKDLPFSKRNVMIYQHGTILENQKEESADLYVYRLAENKAVKIGKISRLLKENSVDCFINAEQMNFTMENFADQRLIITLSNGIVLNDFVAGDYPYSATCDYMESCEYKCISGNEKVEDSKENLDTYNEEFMLINSDKIIIKLKKMFKKNYFFKRTDLLKYVNYPKKFPTEQIYAALTNLISDRSERLVDRYGREGRLVNIGEYYLFQPIELNNENISIYDRSVPVSFKIDNVQVQQPTWVEPPKEIEIDKIDVKGTDLVLIEELNIIGKNVFTKMQNLYNLAKSSFSIERGEDDWYKVCGAVIVKLAKEGMPVKDLQDFLIYHIIESLMFDEKFALLNYLRLNKTTCGSEKEIDVFKEKVKKYFCEMIINKDDLYGMILVDGPLKKNIIYLVDRNNKWELATPEDQRDLSSVVSEKYPTLSNLNEFVGFIGFEDKNKYMVFKVKDTKQSRNKGSRCDQAGKQKTLQLLNKIVGQEKYTKENTRGQVLLELCVRQEFILRYNSLIKKYGKVWFVTPEESVINSFSN